MKNRIKYIVFDVGGVLLSHKIDPIHDNLNKKAGKNIFSRKSMLHKKFLKGKISQKEHYDGLADKVNFSSSELQNMMEKEYTKTQKINTPVMNLARKIKSKGYKIAVLTNVTPEHKKINLKNKIYEIFFPRIISCDTGYMKPQKEIWLVLLKKTKTRPDEIVYIDDRKEFLLPAKSLGMKTIHFRNARQLRRDLKKFGVDV